MIQFSSVSCVDCSVVLASIEIKLKAVSINFKIEIKIKRNRTQWIPREWLYQQCSWSPCSRGAAPASPCSRCRWPWAARSWPANHRSVLWYSDQSQLTCPAGRCSWCWCCRRNSPAFCEKYISCWENILAAVKCCSISCQFLQLRR